MELEVDLQKQQVCVQEFQLGFLQSQITRNHNLQATTIQTENQKQKQTVIFKERKYESSCNYNSEIYHIKIEDKVVFMEIYNLHDGQWRRASFKFNARNKIAHQGCWFQIINRQFCIVVVDTQGHIYIKNIQDVQERGQIRQQNLKINQINQIFQINQINFEDIIETNTLSFIGSANDDLIVFIHVDKLNIRIHEPQEESSFTFVDIHSMCSLQGVMQNTWNKYVSTKQHLRDPLKFAAKINNSHSIIVTASNEIKVCLHGLGTSLRVQKVQMNFQSGDSSEDIRYKYYLFGFNRQNQMNEVVSSLLSYSLKSIDLIQISFSKRQGDRIFLHQMQVVDLEYNDINAYISLSYQPQYVVFNCYLIDEYLVVEGQNSILEFVNVMEPKKLIPYMNPYLHETQDKSEGLEFIHVTLEGMIFSIYKFSLNVITMMDHSQLCEANISNYLSKVFQKSLLKFGETQDLSYCIQKLSKQDFDHQLHNDDQRNLRIIDLMVSSPQFQQSLIKILSKPVVKFEIIDALLMENIEVWIYLKPHFRKGDRDILMQKCITLMDYIKQFLQQDKDQINYDASRSGRNSEIYPILEGYSILNLNVLLQYFLSHIILYSLHESDVKNLDLWTEFDVLVRQLVTVQYFLQQQNSVVTLLRNVNIFIHRSDFQLISITQRTMRNCNKKFMKLLFRGMSDDKLPFLFQYLFEILQDYGRFITMTEILNINDVYFNYHLVFASNAEKRMQGSSRTDFKKVVIKLGHQINLMDMDASEFSQGPWAKEYYSNDLNLQGSKKINIIFVGVQNIFSNEQKLVAILLKDRNILNQNKIEICLHYLSSDQEQFKNMVFRTLFECALRENQSHLCVNLLKISKLVQSAQDDYTLSRQKTSIMEIFIDKYCSSASLEELHNFGLGNKIHIHFYKEKAILKDIHNYMVQWNNKFFNKQDQFYKELVKNRSDQLYLANDCRIFFQQNKFLFQKGLMRQATGILLSYLSFLAQIQEEYDNQNNQISYCLLLEERLKVISLIIEQCKIKCGNHIDERFENIFEHDHDWLHVDSIQQTHDRLDVQLQVYKLYGLKVKIFQDLVYVLLQKQNYSLLVQYWTTGDYFLFFEGLNLMLTNPNPLNQRLLKQLLDGDAFQIYRNQIINVIIISLIQTNQLQQLENMIRELGLESDIFKITTMLQGYEQNIELMQPTMIEYLNKMIKLRTDRDLNDQYNPIALPVYEINQVMQQSNLLNTQKLILSNTFLQEAI